MASSEEKKKNNNHIFVQFFFPAVFQFRFRLMLGPPLLNHVSYSDLLEIFEVKQRAEGPCAAYCGFLQQLAVCSPLPDSWN